MPKQIKRTHPQHLSIFKTDRPSHSKMGKAERVAKVVARAEKILNNPHLSDETLHRVRNALDQARLLDRENKEITRLLLKLYVISNC